MNLIEILPNIYGVKGLINENYKAVYYVNGNQTLIFKSDWVDAKPLITLDGRWDFLGTITAPEIIFDASEVVESQDFADMDYDGNYIEVTRYWDYEYKQFGCMDSDESFRSALPKEIYFENPFGETQVIRFKDKSKLSKIRDIEWQTAQQNITEKLLILQKL